MNTKALRQKILDLAIHGKLVPQDPNDEPASVLLERIKAEKERLIKEGKIKRTKRSKAACDKPHYPFQLPEGWCWCKLGDICRFENGYAFSSNNYMPTGTPLIRIANISENKIDLSSCVYIQEKVDDRFTISYGDLLIAMSGATTGKLGVYLHKDKALLNQRVGNLKIINLDSLLPEYRNYFMQSKVNEILKRAYGGAQPNISSSNICDIDFLLPPLKEQHRIVEKVKYWFALIDIIESGKDDLQETIKQAKSKILDLAIHGKLVPQDPSDEPATELLKRFNPKAEIACDNPQYGKLPNGWCLIQGKSLYKPMKSMKPKDSVFNYIDIDSINNAKQSIDSVKVVKTENAPSRASRYTQKGDIVFSMVRPYLKNIAMVPANNCIASTGFYVCSPSNVAISKYCYYLMISDYTVSGLNQFMKGDNSPSINRGDIDNWLFPLPPLSEQHRIVSKIEELFTQLDNITSSL